MIKKLRIDELQKGMLVSGFQKDRSDKALFFMNSLLIKNDEELQEFYDYGYRSAYVDVAEETDPAIDTREPAKAGSENPKGLKTNLKGIEEYRIADTPPDRPEAQQTDSEDNRQTGRRPGPAKFGLLSSEAAMPETTEPETTEPETTEIETAESETTGIKTASPDIGETDELEAESPGALETNETTDTAKIETAQPEASGETDYSSDIETALPETSETDEAAGTTGIEATAPGANSEADYPGDTETVLPETSDTDDIEAAAPEKNDTDESAGATGVETAAPETPDKISGTANIPDDIPDIDAAPSKSPGEELVEGEPRQSGHERSTAGTSPKEAPAKRIKLVEKPADTTTEELERIEVVADLTEYKEEIETAAKIRDDAERLVRKFMHDKHGELQPERVHEAVEQMVDSIFRNRDALSSLVRLKSADDYTFGHCVNVCILSMTLGRQMGFTKKTAHDLGVGAVLHDIGKTRIQEKTLQKPGPLSDTEFDEIRTHPVLGAELLLDAAGIKDESKHVVVQHHEKYNGTGYPYKKEGDNIHVFARIAAVADVYDAMTSTRVYQKNLPPDIVLQKMYMWREVHFESNIVERLIKCLGIYPIGTLVELNTGEIAVVTANNPNNPIKPGILVLFDEDKIRIPKPVEVNLSSEMTRWVVESKDPRKFGVDIEDIIA